jgi:hypothetical protein
MRTPEGHEDQLLARELRARSRDIDGSPARLDTVKERAHAIRVRRRIATGAVAAAVLALALPAGLAVTGGDTGSQGPVGRPTPTSGVSHTADPRPQRPEGAVDLTTVGLTRGADPGIVFLDGTTARYPGGQSVTLPAAYSALTPFHGGWLANSFDQGEASVVELDPNNQVVRSTPGASGFAVSADGLVAWAEYGAPGRPGTLVKAIATGMGEGRSTLDLPADTQVQPVGFVGGGQLVYQTYGTDPEVRVTDFDGTSRRVPGAISARGTSQAADRVAVQTRSTDDGGSCWAVMAPDGDLAWDTCAYALGKFSLDGRYLIGTDPYGDGLGDSWMAILDAGTGKEVARYQRPANGDLFIHDMVWEDDTHVLAIVHQGIRWRIIRLDDNGHVESASEARVGDEASWPFVFIATP